MASLTALGTGSGNPSGFAQVSNTRKAAMSSSGSWWMTCR